MSRILDNFGSTIGSFRSDQVFGLHIRLAHTGLVGSAVLTQTMRFFLETRHQPTAAMQHQSALCPRVVHRKKTPLIHFFVNHLKTGEGGQL